MFSYIYCLYDDSIGHFSINMRATFYFFFLVLFSLVIRESKAQDVYKLWDGQIKPFFKENNVKEYEKESWGTMCVFNVTEPTLTVYKAKGENTSKAIIIIPGGGYTLEAIYHEGYDVAEVLSKHGITAAVLKYRLPNPETSDRPNMVPLTDARRALKLLREQSGKYGINKEKIGVMGFSAGSHLATVASLWRSDDQEENPNFSILIYGTTNLTKANLQWLEESLYHRKLTEEEVAQNSLLELVSENTPPAFLVHAYDDDVCDVRESILYARELFNNKVMVEMHLFPKGGHGFGLGREEDGTNQWIQLCINWLKSEIL